MHKADHTAKQMNEKIHIKNLKINYTNENLMVAL